MNQETLQIKTNVTGWNRIDSGYFPIVSMPPRTKLWIKESWRTKKLLVFSNEDNNQVSLSTRIIIGKGQYFKFEQDKLQESTEFNIENY